MDRKHRIAIQRAMACEAIAKLHAAAEFFGVDERSEQSAMDFDQWDAAICKFEGWLWTESPIA